MSSLSSRLPAQVRALALECIRENPDGGADWLDRDGARVATWAWVGLPLGFRLVILAGTVSTTVHLHHIWRR